MSSKKVLTGAERKAAITAAGVKLAAKHGSANITRRMLSEAAKVSEALVSSYMGDVPKMRKAIKAAAKKAGVAEPTAEQQEKIGAKLRAHGPRDKRDTRKRSAKEVEAIKRKAVPAKKSAATSAKRAGAGNTRSTLGRVSRKAASASERETKPAAPKETPTTAPKNAPKVTPPSRGPVAPAERKSAARQPIAPPTLPPPPLPPAPPAAAGEPPQLPKNLVGSFP